MRDNSQTWDGYCCLSPQPQQFRLTPRLLSTTSTQADHPTRPAAASSTNGALSYVLVADSQYVLAAGLLYAGMSANAGGVLQ